MGSTSRSATFMKSPLVIWVNSLQEEKCAQKEIKDYNELSSGGFLTRVWLQIDPLTSQPTFQSAVTGAQDTSGRLRNLSWLLNNIKLFYENVLDETLVLRLPDVIKIASNASDESSSCEEMRVLLLLLLGCAVQCDRKEHFIEGIKQLDIGVQHSIVQCIQQITDNPDSVWLNSEWALLPEDESEKHRLYGLLVQHVNRLAKERDELFNRIIDLSLELDSISGSESTESPNSLFISSPHITHSVGEQKSHILVELADVKSKLRRVQQELEEKNEVVSELKEILEQNKESVNKLRHDNLELIQEARSAKAFRDEIDVLNERVRKVDRLESEVQRYRDRMNELDFYKSRVEELREDNRILGETKSMLEEQLDTSRKRADQLPDLEAKILKLSAYTNELTLQKDLDRSQIETLVEEITHLRLDKKSNAEELTKVQSELAHLRCQMKIDLLQQNGEGNLLEQINNDASKRVLKLELENQRLQSLVENIKNNRSSDMSTTLLNDNNNHSIYSDDIPNGNFTDDMLSPNDVSMTSDSVSLSVSTEFSAKLEQIENENQVLRNTVERVKSAESKIGQLERVRTDLSNQLKELKSKQSLDYHKYEQIEKNCSNLMNENQRLQRLMDNKNKRYDEIQQEVQALESENQKLMTTAETLKASVRRLNDLEREVTNLEADNHRLEQEKKSVEKEVLRLKAAIEAKDTTIDEYASRLSTIELENKQMKKDIEHNTETNIKLKEAEKENKEMANELFVCKETITTLRQDLVTEKIKSQQMSCELEKIDTAIDAVFRVKTNFGADANYATKDWNKFFDEVTDQIVKKSSEQKEVKINALEDKVKDLSEANARLNSSLESLTANDKSEPRVNSNVISELQRKVTLFEDENKNLKNDIITQKQINNDWIEKCKSLESSLDTMTAKNSEMSSDRAKLQVENSLIKSQNSSLVSQNENLEAQISLVQDVRDKLQSKHKELEHEYKVLAKDHEALQTLHQQLTADYESQSTATSNLKCLYKKLKTDHKTVQDKLDTWLTSQQLQQIRDQTESDDQKRSDDNQMTEKFNKLEEENKSLNEEHKRLQTEYKMLQNIYKKLRSENNDLKLKHTELQGETAECRDRMALLDVEVSKLANYCEMVALTNNSIESQRKRLINSISNLLSQYHDLLTQIGGDTEQVISDRMHDLSAKKERLEKMIKDYDLTLEKKKVAVTNQNVVRRIHRSSTDLCLTKNQSKAVKGVDQRDRSRDRNSAPIDTLVDEAIYGRIWEAETPPIPSNTAILRPFRSTSSSSLALEQSNSKSPEVVKPINSDPINQIKEEIRRTENNCVISPVPPPRPPPRVSTTIENKIHLSVITSPMSPTRSPLNGGETVAQSVGRANHFTRGTFKSNSINYGSPIRRQAPPSKNGVHHIHHFHHIHPHSASPSLNSDSSLTPLEDSELSDSALNNRSRIANTNCDNVTVNSSATNSVWYEYGCV